MQKFCRLSLFLAAVAVLTCACSPAGEIFIKDEKIAAGYQHVADIDVHRRGFWLLWIIPFKLGCEPAAQMVMEEETLKSYPRADGIYEYRVVDSYGPWFWVSGTRIVGKIVVKDE